MPVIAARQPRAFVHALLNDRPLAGLRQDEAVQVDLEAVDDRVVVDLGREPAGPHQRLAVEAGLVGDRSQFGWRVARVLAAAAADINPQLMRARIQSALQARQERKW